MIYRELRSNEFDRIPAEALDGHALPFGARISGALDEDGKIVGIWVVTFALHAEPIWIKKEHQKHPVIIRRLWDGVKAIVRDLGLPGVVGIIPDSVPADKRIAEWVGAKPIPGAVYLWLDKKEK